MNRTLFTTHSNAIKYLEWILFLIPRAVVVRDPSGVHFVFYSWDVLCYETLKENFLCPKDSLGHEGIFSTLNSIIFWSLALKFLSTPYKLSKQTCTLRGNP